MKRIKTTRRTVYFHTTPVVFGAHRALVRPREGHEVHVESSQFEVIQYRTSGEFTISTGTRARYDV